MLLICINRKFVPHFVFNILNSKAMCNFYTFLIMSTFRMGNPHSIYRLKGNIMIYIEYIAMMICK